MNHSIKALLIITLWLQAKPSIAQQVAEQKSSASQELALKLANPLASMISVPFQFNILQGVDPFNGSQLVANFQPVIPFTVGKVNIITRTIVPFIDNRNILSAKSSQFGISDVNFSAFLTPAKPGKILLGIGPALSIPTASQSYLGYEKWAAGPTVAIMKQQHGWTYIVLARQLWTFAGKENRKNVSPYFINPGMGYSFKSGAGLGANIEIAGDWENSSNTQTYLNFSASMVSKFGKQPVSFTIGPHLPITSKTLGDWGIRVGFTLIFSTK